MDSDSQANAIARDTQRTLANLNRSLDLLTAAMKAALPVVQSTAAAATAGSATLPTAPAGFLNVTLPNGTAAKVAYYNP